MEYYSATENWNDAICSNTDGPRGYYTKADRERHMSYDSTSVWNLKNNPGEKTNSWLSKGKGQGEA